MDKTEIDVKTIEYCCDVLKETKEAKDVGLLTLRNKITANKQLNAKIDDCNLVRFLRATKYNFEKAENKLNNFYVLRGTTPEWYDNRDPLLPEIQALLKIGVFLPLIQADENGIMVIIIRIAAHNPYFHKQDDVFKVALMILDLVLDKMEQVSIYGVIAVFDMKGISFGHARQLTVPMIKKAVHSWQDCYPIRVKGIHCINSPTYINVVLNIFKSFMREKMRSRVHVHGYDQKSLHNVVSKEILPEEYGGTNGKLQNITTLWRNEVTKNRAWYIEDEKFKFIKDK